jgi:hypothetical protein
MAEQTISEPITADDLVAALNAAGVTKESIGPFAKLLALRGALAAKQAQIANAKKVQADAFEQAEQNIQTLQQQAAGIEAAINALEAIP